MSELGSFVTQYIHCAKCLEAVKSLLLRSEKPDDNDELPIVAGCEHLDLLDNACQHLPEVICHPLSIAYLGKNSSRVFYMYPQR